MAESVTRISEYITSLASGNLIPFNYKFQADLMVTMILEFPNFGCSNVASEEY